MGVEADVILFHPYDHWGFAKMDQAHDEAWARYVVARLGAYRNVWWTIANEYDLMRRRDWGRIGQAVHDADPYRHPLGIHNAGAWYDPNSAWIDHVIVQDGSPTVGRSATISRIRYAKPTVVDEFGYEGNNGNGWGNLSAAEEVARAWDITMAGGYTSHGETYVHPGGVLWWAAGGTLEGESPARLAFLRKVMTALPFQEMVPAPQLVSGATLLAKPGEAYLVRFKPEAEYGGAPSVQLRLAGAPLYRVELIDPWLMRSYPLGFTGPGDQAFLAPLTPGLLRLTAAPPGAGTAKPIGELVASFVGMPPYAPPADPGRFSTAPMTYSADFAVSQLLADPAARAVIEPHFPRDVLASPIVFFPLARLAAVRKLPQAEIDAMDAALRKLPVR